MADFCMFCNKKIGLLGKLTSKVYAESTICGSCIKQFNDALYVYYQTIDGYNARAKRCGITVSLDAVDRHSTIQDSKQDTARKVEGKTLLEQAASVATPKEASIIRLLVDGFALHEAARLLKIPRATAISSMENFCCRARAVIC